jgi:DNA processing protein
MIIVSGMALGIDSFAHIAALDAGGKTIAVLGGGPDVIYPRSNTSLYNRILENDGLILSEQPPGQPPIKGMFVLRNRIISGISRGVMVIEGTHKSGSMITGKLACDQGKNVFVAPMPITSPLSEGPLSLFQQGAQMVTGPEDILDVYGLLYVQSKPQLLSSEESKILSFLITDDLPIETIKEKTKYSFSDLSPLILSLEIKGYVMKTLSGTYQRVRK